MIDARSSAVAMALALATFLWLAPPEAEALPIYAARAGRTCDNCHALPNNWENPDEFWKRKCNLSCMSCHVDPQGGGLRNVSGRYFGKNTLPMYGVTGGRPLNDRTPEEMAQWLSQVRGGEPTSGPASGPTSGPVQPTSQPASDAAAQGVVTDELETGGPVFFRPLLHGSSEMAWRDGRYGKLSADPLVQLGGDARLAFWNPGFLVFPMQADFHLALHPVEHLTISSTTGLRGRKDKLTGDEDFPASIRDVWVMTHEWPMMSYLRVGRFLPGFGTRTADHTAYIRRAFDLTQEDPADRVLGAEIGFAANYPYVNLTGFLTTVDSFNPFKTGEGQGISANAGWRDLGWQVGLSYMFRERPLGEGGDTEDVSVQWGLNPWFYWETVPLTYIGELTVGLLRERLLSGGNTSQIASFHELSWALSPGLNLRARYDFWEPDVEVKDDEVHRPGIGVDWTIIEGVTLGLDARFTAPVGGELNPDGILQLHGWF